MKYPAFIEMGDDSTAFGIHVPDVPGFFSAGDTMDKLLVNAAEGLQSHIQLLLELGKRVPAPSELTKAMAEENSDGVLMYIEIDPNFDTKERVNISVPKYVLNYIETQVQSNPEYKDRSDFITKTTVEKMYG